MVSIHEMAESFKKVSKLLIENQFTTFDVVCFTIGFLIVMRDTDIETFNDIIFFSNAIPADRFREEIKDLLQQ